MLRIGGKRSGVRSACSIRLRGPIPARPMPFPRRAYLAAHARHRLSASPVSDYFENACKYTSDLLVCPASAKPPPFLSSPPAPVRRAILRVRLSSRILRWVIEVN
eukprot:5191707-Prymnesium_polylepis.1